MISANAPAHWAEAHALRYVCYLIKCVAISVTLLLLGWHFLMCLLKQKVTNTTLQQATMTEYLSVHNVDC